MQSISLVIPTCNRPDNLARLLASLEECHDFRTCIQEVIVVSDGSKSSLVPRYRDLCLEFQVEFLAFSQGRGPSFARNAGASRASSDWILFFDDDVLVRSDYFITLKSLRPHASQVAFEGITEVEASQSLSQRAASTSDYRGGYGSGNFLVRRSSFVEIGGFDQMYFRRRGRLHFREDSDLGLRLCSLGEVALKPDLKVYHPARPDDIWALARDARKYWFEAYFLRMNPKARALIGGWFLPGSLGTRQTRGLMADLAVLSLLTISFIGPWPLIAFSVVYGILLFRRQGVRLLEWPLLPLISLCAMANHFAYYWMGRFKLARRSRILFDFGV